MDTERRLEVLSMFNNDHLQLDPDDFPPLSHIGDVMASPESTDSSFASSLDSSSSEDESEEGCPLCSSKFEVPRVLSCLHIFCEKCITQHHESNEVESDMLRCPKCEQETKLTAGISGLPLDYITSNRLNMQAIENMEIVCTSCKAKEKAVACCTDCATFLCNNCVTAHQYMRCFENHLVAFFEELKGAGDGMLIHKPVTCPTHNEDMKYYCRTCHIPICNECMVSDHKQPEHCYEKVTDAESKQKEMLKDLVAESKGKLDCGGTSAKLNACLSDLQLQRDNAKSHIEETFQSYKAILEKQQEQLLKELDSIHSSQELQVMDTFHNIDVTMEKIDFACKFAERLLNHGNALELLSLKHVVSTQLLSLINNTPKLEISTRVSFETDEKKFEASVKETFGHVVTPEASAKSEETPDLQKVSPLHSSSSFDNEAYSMPPIGVADSDHSLRPLDVDLANNIVVQYNLAQLAGMADNASETLSNSATSPMSFSDLLNTTSEADMSVTTAQLNAIKNLTALAKMGSVSLDNRQVMLNGHFASSLNIDTDSMNPSPVHSPPTSNEILRAINTPSPIESLESLLNGSSLVTSPRVCSPLNGVSGSIMRHRMQSLSMMPPPTAISPMPGSSYNPTPRSAAVKLSTMQIRCKFGQLGPGKGQFSSPHGFCLGLDQEIIVADTNNHRIQVFDKTGDFRYQFGVAGKEEGQLWYPRKVAVIRSSGKFVVCDRGSERSRMQIFTKTGHFLRKIAIRYIDIVAGLAITSEGNIVAVDSVAPTVFIIYEGGDLLKWFDCSEHMREPSDIAVSGKEFYVCDFKGHCVIVFSESGQFLRKIGNENITNFPNGIDIGDAGDVLVGDSHGNRFHIVVFSRQGVILSEFECPYVKVSRCCGLKITSEGYVVTLAKNNHHVLVLNTLYIV